jgi:hypothetical protein
VRRAVFEQAVVVGVGAADAPAQLGVVAGLVRQERRRFLGLEVHSPLGVGITFRLVEDVHPMRVGRVACSVRTPGM